MKKTRRSAEKSIQVKIWTEIIGGGTGEIISYNFYAEFIFQASTKPLRSKIFYTFFLSFSKFVLLLCGGGTGEHKSERN